MKLSVVIPTYNRLDSLTLCLEKLSQQSLSCEFFEIIVVDDGSSVSCQNEVETIFDKYGLTGRYWRQNNAGPAAARNRGVELANGEVVVFIGDDMMGEKDFLQVHYDFHNLYPQDYYAALGRVEWPLDWLKTDFMKWLDETSFQFDFVSLISDNTADYKHFYTSNISLKRNFLLTNGLFNESFPYAAFEDTELGYRLEKMGLKLIYKPQSLVYHYHQLTLDYYLSRMEKAGVSAAVLCGLHPELVKEFVIKKSLAQFFKDFVKKLIYLAAKILKQPQWEKYYYRSMLLDRYIYGYKHK